jgi:hypothetical protein
MQQPSEGPSSMQTRHTRTTRREMTFVLGVAVAGLALVVLVAFAPWYEPVMLG